MSQKIKVSIIVPVYKAEKYLTKCLDSLVNQSLKNIEIICINDGSPDNSLEIIKKFKNNYDSLIKIIDKKNEGVWKARMDGIKAAQGEYICFIDSDDYVERDFAKKLYESITDKKADISICGFKRIDSNTGNVLSCEMKFNSSRIIDTEKNIEELISINTSLWNKIFKSDILKNLKEIDNPPRILEDMMFLSLVYLKIKKVAFVDDYLYNYMVIQGSAMNTIKENEVNSIKNAMINVKEEYVKNNATKNQIEMLSAMAFLHFGISLMFCIYKNDNINFKKEYKENLKYLDENFPMWRKTKYINLIYNFTHGFVNGKVAIVKKVYVLHMFKLFLDIYSFVTKTLKIDIKW